MEKGLHILGWILSVVLIVCGVFGMISELKHGAANAVEFFGAFIVFGLAVNPMVLRSVRLFGHAYLTIVAGAVVAVGLICLASWYAA